jgi:uncharacterized protein involved in exopolysaccharide biosynthesis
MGLQVNAAIMRWPILAALAIAAVFTIIGYGIHSSPPAYSQSATVVFTVTKSLAGRNDSGSFTGSLVATDVMMAAALSSPAAQAQIREAGGTASFTVAPFNLYDMQYPDYAAPSAVLTVTGASPVAVRTTFTRVLRFLGQRMAGLQAQAHVPHRDRIGTFLAAATGPAPHEGSPVRVFGGLAVLAAMSVFTLCRRRAARVR